MADPTLLLSRADSLFARDGGLHPPPEVLLSWPNPNYVDPEERGWEATILLAVVLGITFLVYTARMWARLAIAKSAGMDDLLMSVAMLPLFGLTISAILATKVYGFQWHAWDQTPESHITTREVSHLIDSLNGTLLTSQITLAIELNYLVSTTLIKISILCFYQRLSGSLKTVFVYGVWAAIASCVVYGVIYTFLLIFTCNPVIGNFRLFDLAWRLENELTCLDEGAIIVSCAVISTIQDLVICLLPVFLVWNLKIHRRQKAALIAIFALGLVTCVCGIMRTYYATFVYNCKPIHVISAYNKLILQRYLRHYLVCLPRLGVDSVGGRPRDDLRIRARTQGFLQPLLLRRGIKRRLSYRNLRTINPYVSATTIDGALGHCFAREHRNRPWY
jgi:hypothetical protein